tara:strand:- start:11305 stop:11412 length:108 start_codon:yes stop_codon:yes gene_type:complete
MRATQIAPLCLTLADVEESPPHTSYRGPLDHRIPT